MADPTPRLGYPRLDEAQENPDEPLNDATLISDALVQATAITITDEPPDTQVEGDAYIVFDDATGAWAGHDDDIAVWQDGSWKFYTPRVGWKVYVEYFSADFRYTGDSPGGWTQIAEGSEFSGDASDVPYDNGTSGLAATDVQAAIDELADLVEEGGGGGVAYPPDVPPGTPNTADDEFDGAALDTTGARFTGATAWATINPGTAVYAQAQGCQRIRTPVESGNNLRGFEQVISGPGVWRCKMAANCHSENFNTAGFFFRVNASDRWQGVVSQYSGGPRVGTQRMDSRSSFSAATITDHSFMVSLNSWVYWELEYDGTNVYFRASGTGIEGSFIPIGERQQAAVAGHLGAAPDRIVLAAEGNNSTYNAGLVVEWFRRIS